MITDEVRQAIMTDWLGPKDAAQLAGISYGWLRLLGERGQVETLQTPLGTLYSRKGMEAVARDRAERGKAAA